MELPSLKKASKPKVSTGIKSIVVGVLATALTLAPGLSSASQVKSSTVESQSRNGTSVERIINLAPDGGGILTAYHTSHASHSSHSSHSSHYSCTPGSTC